MMGETGGDQLLARSYLDRYDLTSALAFRESRYCNLNWRITHFSILFLLKTVGTAHLTFSLVLYPCYRIYTFMVAKK